ncbi:MAG: metallophosphoesterase family protein [Leuconostoc pseudomesenteroides]|uniref:metallophosphoesterase family protein n=1 Tax=Leuconostoc pseudomesenteroides TaxID=33968 RepID=UPI001E613ECB|nr:metallophosphoesterase family protein [Leuconostoc pseudomesenteroides]MCC7668514.1 phosphoesterase [Leuconostoc pseudomesenteroides]MCT4387403.1 phosphoesterase [Leuconostoc pseudomesenteroides]
MNFIISDTHFNHEKILYFDKSRADALRNLDIEPTVSNMDQYLENQWNDTVNDDDVVYFLGDLGMFRKKQDFVAQLARLKGQKVFFKGNHDHSDQLKAALKAPETKLIEVVDTAKAIKINGIQVWLSHYAIDLPYPILSVHGHIHEAEYESPSMVNLSLDSVLMQQYPFGQPLSFDKLWLELKKRLEMIEQSYAIESENKRFDRQVERAFDEVITINKPTPTQRHELALLVEYLNKNHLTYADVLERFDIPNVNKQLSLDEKMAVSQTGYEFEKATGLAGNSGGKGN